MGLLGLIGGAIKGGLTSGITQGVGSFVGGLFKKKKNELQDAKNLAGWQSMLEEDRMNLQATLNKEQAKYNSELAKSMFNFTMKQEAEYNDPKKQMERLKNAGLNPALMYGQGAAGASGIAEGSTAGAGAAQGVTALQPMGLQVALQMEMQKAQIDALNAQTLNTNAQTAKTESEIENTKSGTKLNEAKFKETLKNIDAISENIRKSKVDTAETEFKNEILNEIRNQTINRYINGDESGTPIKIVEILAGNKIKEVLNENKKLSNDEIELLNNKEILTALSNDIEAIAQGEVDKLKIPSENKKLLKKQYERNEWELRNDKALGDILNAIGGNDKYSKLLQGIAKWLFSK